MLIRHIGHAEFLIELESGYRIVTDPYDAGCGYPVRKEKADAVLVSHHHHDHDAVENVGGTPQVIDAAGQYTLAKGVTVTALEAFHDDAQGAKRGKTLLFLLEAEGLRVAHLGDLGCGLNAEQVKALRNPDILMIPVGGFFTIDADTAVDVVRLLKARVILPMHYRTEANAGWPIAPVDDFIAAMGVKAETLRLLRVTAEDLGLQPRLAVLERRRAE